MERQEIDLYTLGVRLKEGIESLFPQRQWVKAEISSIKLRSTGHCYLELCQSNEGRLLAKFNAIIWSSKYRLLSAFFKSETETELAEGMQVLVEVQVNYSELYGFSLIINDIDPSYSLGKKEADRQKTINTLVEKGYIGKQKMLKVNPLSYRFAIISAQNAAGLRDFLTHINENEYGFYFETTLFESIMQGVESPTSIVSAINSINKLSDFDAILIIRGGGSNLDLACYDDYDLAVAIADSGLPVFTAVGHDQDYHICDMVAYNNLKTPTALADYFISIFIDEDAMITSYASRLKLGFINKINQMSSKIDLLESKITSADPRKIINRGYILALDENGRVVSSTSSLKIGENLRLMLKDGLITSLITQIKKN